MPIFAHQLRKIDPQNPADAIRKLADHIAYIQEQLEYTLLNLDSRNINEIDTDKTTITDSIGSVNIGSYISIKGDNGESFTVGKNDKGEFEFSVRGRSDEQAIVMTRDGVLNIRDDVVNLAVDGGVW